MLNFDTPSTIYSMSIKYYVWAVYFDTPQTLDWARVDLHVWVVSKLTHPKDIIGH